MWDFIADALKTIFAAPEVLQGLALVIGWVLVRLIWKGGSLVGIQRTDERLKALQWAVDKAMTLGVSRADDFIRARGWDSPSTRYKVITESMPIMIDKFRDTLRENGLDPTNEADREKIRDQMERMFSDVVERLSKSPATPPVDEPAAKVDLVVDPPRSA